MSAQGPYTGRENGLAAEDRTGIERGPEPSLNREAAGSAGGVARAGANGGTAGAAQQVVRLTVNARSALLKELIEMIGVEGAERLIGAFGGLRLYVPQWPEPGDALSEAVGHQAAVRLAKVFGGDRIEIPNPTARGTHIIELRASGLRIDEIARAQHCTVRRVYQVLAEARRVRPQRQARPAHPAQ